MRISLPVSLGRLPLRPPGASLETEFIAACIRCGQCAQVCPYKSIRIMTLFDGIENMGAPTVEPRVSPCYLCMKCPPVCPSGALDRKLTDRARVRMGTAVINKKTCLAYQDTLCRSCYQSCPLIGEAIEIDAELRPIIDKEKCVGCGVCERVCPVEPQAITINPRGNR